MFAIWYGYYAYQDLCGEGIQGSERKNKEPIKPKEPEKPQLKTPEKPKDPPKVPEKPKEQPKVPEKPKEVPKGPEKPKDPIKVPENPKEPPKVPEKPKEPFKVPEKPKTPEKTFKEQELFKPKQPEPTKPVSSFKEAEKVFVPVYETESDEEVIDDDSGEGSDDEFIPIMVTKYVRMHWKTWSKPKSRSNRAAKMVDAATMDKLEAGFKKLQESDSKSLLKKYLTKDVFEKTKNLKTPSFGSTLLDCIQSGVENLDSGVGIYAPDAESYSVFSELFDPIIEDYHQGFKKGDKHPNKDWGDVDSLGNLDPTGEFVVSTRVRCGRSMEGYPFNPCLTEAQYKEMEEKVSSTLSAMTGELKGTYYPLTGMTKETQQKLIDDHFLFKEGDRFLQAANACRFWPTGRGIYHNDNKTFLVWCNEEDHLRLISMQMGGDLGQVYRRLVTAVNDIEKRVPFSHHERLGFLTFCPTNLGTTVRASVHIKVPKLAANKAKLDEVAAKFNLQVRGTRGEHTEAEGGVYDISNKRRMGLTEYQAVKEMNDGILEIIKMEKEL